MAIRNIVPDTDEILHKKCRVVDEVNEKIKTLALDMIDTLRKSEGIGLAGPQVGVLKRIFVINTLNEEQEEFKVFINPEIIAKMGEQESPEGCLSIVNHRYLVKRPEKVAVKALDIDGNEFVWEAEELMACAVCHEYDHLDGKTIKDTCEYEIEDEDYEEE